MKIHRRLRVIGVSLVICLLFVACEKKEEIKIGYVAELSGSSSQLGVEGMYGALLAVENINKNGGINGRKIELITKDGLFVKVEE